MKNWLDEMIFARDLQDDAQHGNRGGGALHALAVAGGVAGFMSGADKQKLDQATDAADPDTLPLRNSDGGLDVVYLRLGSHTAESGEVRLFNGAKITARNHAGTDDLRLVEVDEGTDDVMFGTGADNVTIRPDGATVLEAGGLTRFYVSTNVGFFAAPSAGGGVGVVYVANRTTAPTTNPTGGGLLYAENGAGKWRGSSGTVTTIGPAEPHCPSCTRDFAHEWQNANTGEHLAICLPCMLAALAAAGVDVARFAFINTLGSTP